MPTTTQERVNSFFNDAPAPVPAPKKRQFSWATFRAKPDQDDSDDEQREEKEAQTCHQPTALFLDLLFRSLPPGGHIYSDESPPSHPDELGRCLTVWKDSVKGADLYMASPEVWENIITALSVPSWATHLEESLVLSHVKELASAATSVASDLSRNGSRGWDGWGDVWSASDTSSLPAPSTLDPTDAIVWPVAAGPVLAEARHRADIVAEASPLAQEFFGQMVKAIASMQMKRRTSSAAADDESARWAADRLCASAFSNWLWFQHDLAFSSLPSAVHFKIPLLARSQARLLISLRLWSTALLLLEERFYATRDAHEEAGNIEAGSAPSFLGRVSRWRRKTKITTSSDQVASTRGNQMSLDVWGASLEQVLRGLNSMLVQTKKVQQGICETLLDYASIGSTISRDKRSLKSIPRSV